MGFVKGSLTMRSVDMMEEIAAQNGKQNARIATRTSVSVTRLNPTCVLRLLLLLFVIEKFSCLTFS